MDQNSMAGAARNFGGKAQEAVGRTTGDSRAASEGVVNQLKGTVQDLYGQARDSATDAAGAAREMGFSLEQALRDAVEQQPYIAVAVALGVGWLLGRSHRPL